MGLFGRGGESRTPDAGSKGLAFTAQGESEILSSKGENQDPLSDADHKASTRAIETAATTVGLDQGVQFGSQQPQDRGASTAGTYDSDPSKRFGEELYRPKAETPNPSFLQRLFGTKKQRSEED